MKRGQWKTGVTPTRPRPVQWPSIGQIFGQLIVVLVVSGLWGALMFGFLSLTEKAEMVAQAKSGEVAEPTEVNEEVVQPTEVKDEATFTPTPSPTPSPTPLPATPTQTATATPTQTVNKPVTATVVTNKPTATAVPVQNTPKATATPQPTIPPTPSPTTTPTPAPTDPPVAPTSEAPPTDAAEAETGVSFKNDVMPIFERRCIKCHGGRKTEEGLVLKTYQDLLDGSDNGPVIEPGNVEKSYLIELIVNGKMPKKEPHLLNKEIQIITEWVKAGAKDN